MTDLDDFFAKKDKKKTKKPKFLTADELVKNLEDTKKETTIVKPKKLEPIVTESTATLNNVVSSSSSSGIATTTITTVSTSITPPPSLPSEEKEREKLKPNEEVSEEEWKDFEEEQRKDYTGLKIGQLTLTDDDELSPTDGDDEDGDSETTTRNLIVKPTNNGAWKKVVPAEEVTQIQMESQPKVYVSPAFRQSQAARAGPKARRTAPDITNADYFPTLGAARPEEQRKKKNEPAFEEVRHGGRVQRVPETTVTTKAAVETNRFQSLDDDDN